MLFPKSIIPGVARATLYVATVNTTDWYGRWQLMQNPSNDWMIDPVAASGPALADGHFVYTNDEYYNDSLQANTVTAFSVARNGELTFLTHFPTGDFACSEVQRQRTYARKFTCICAAASAASNHHTDKGIEEPIPVLDSTRTRSNWRLTPTFRRMERS
jgi:hypothetical protein